MRAFDWSKTPLGPAGDLAAEPAQRGEHPAAVEGVRSSCSGAPSSSSSTTTPTGRSSAASTRRARACPAREAWSEIWDTVLHELLRGRASPPARRTGRATGCSSSSGTGTPRRRSSTSPTIRCATRPARSAACSASSARPPAASSASGGCKTLRELGLRTSEEAKSAEEACRNAARILGGEPPRPAVRLLYLLRRRRATRRTTGGSRRACRKDRRPLRSTIDLERRPRRRAGPAWPLRAVLESGRADVVTDLEQRFGALPGGAWPEPPHTRGRAADRQSRGRTASPGSWSPGISPRRALDDQYRALPRPAGEPDRHRDRQRPRLRGGAAARRGAGRARSREDRVLQQREPRVPHAAHAHARPGRGAAGEEPYRPVARRGQPSRRRQPQRPAPAAAGQHAARLLAHRGRPGRGPSYQPTDLAAFTAELASVFRAAVERAGLRLLVDCPSARASRSSSTATCGRRSSSTCSRTPSSSPSKARSRSRCGRRTASQVELRVRDTGTGIPAARDAPPVRAVPPRRERRRGARTKAAGSGSRWCRSWSSCTAARSRRRAWSARARPSSSRCRWDRRTCRPTRSAQDRALASTATGAAPFVEEALRWLPDEARRPRRRAPPSSPTAYETLPVPAPGAAHGRATTTGPASWWRTTTPTCGSYVVRLLAEHYRVEAVPDGEAALAAVRRERPGPGAHRRDDAAAWTASACCASCAPTPPLATLPVILLSARAGEESRVEGLEAGADDYLIKPFSARELLARVQSSLTLARVRREAERVLRQQSAQFKTLLDQAPIGVYLVDADLPHPRDQSGRAARVRRHPRRRRGRRLRRDHPPAVGEELRRRGGADLPAHARDRRTVLHARARRVPHRSRRHRVLRVASRPHSAPRRAQRRGVLFPRHLGAGQRAQGDRGEPRGPARSGPSQGRVPRHALARAARAARAAAQHARDHEARRRRRGAASSRRATRWSGS